MTIEKIMPLVQLIPMTEQEYEQRRPTMIAGYAAENVRAGYWKAEEAQQKAEETFARLLPNGVATEFEHLFTVLESSSNQVVGLVWLHAQHGSGFIYDIEIDVEHRRKGYGEAAMLAIEDEARKLGLTQIGLHVFAHNPAAVKLYEKIGYLYKSHNMIKPLE